MVKRPCHGLPRPEPLRFRWVFPKVGPLLFVCLLLWAAAVPWEDESLQAAAQELNQASLLHVEKTAQSYLLEPRYSPLSFPFDSSARTRRTPPSGQTPLEPASQSAAPDVFRTRLSIAWGYYNQGDYEEALPVFQDLAQQETTADVAEEARLGLAYALLRLRRLPQAARLLEELVGQGIRPRETVPALVDVLLTLKRYEDAEKYLPLLP